MEMIEVGVGQQDQVNGGEVLDLEAGSFDALEQKEPVGEVGINQNIEVGKLEEEGGMTDPGDGDLAGVQFGESRVLGLPGAPGQQRLPDHFAEESPRVEVPGRGELLEGTRQRLAAELWPIRGTLLHKALAILFLLHFE